MMSTGQIARLSDEAAYRAAKLDRKPLVVWPQSAAEDIRHVPFLGGYVPVGWRLAEWDDLSAKPAERAIPWGNGERALFMVDSSGLGAPYEPALTFLDTVEYVCKVRGKGKRTIGFAIAEEGQFQIVMGVYVRDPKAPGVPAPDLSGEDRCDPSDGADHTFTEDCWCQTCDDCGMTGGQHDPEVEH